MEKTAVRSFLIQKLSMAELPYSVLLNSYTTVFCLCTPVTSDYLITLTVFTPSMARI